MGDLIDVGWKEEKAASWVARRGLRRVRIGSPNLHLSNHPKGVKGIYKTYKNPSILIKMLKTKTIYFQNDETVLSWRSMGMKMPQVWFRLSIYSQMKNMKIKLWTFFVWSSTHGEYPFNDSRSQFYIFKISVPKYKWHTASRKNLLTRRLFVGQILSSLKTAVRISGPWMFEISEKIFYNGVSDNFLKISSNYYGFEISKKRTS